MIPTFSSAANVFVTFVICYAVVFVFGIKLISQSRNAVTKYGLIVVFAALTAALFDSQYLYKKFYEASLVSNTWLFIMFAGAFIIALSTALLHDVYLNSGTPEGQGRKKIFLFLLIFDLCFLSIFLLGTIKEKLFLRDDVLKLYIDQSGQFLGSEGDVIVLKKHPELIDLMIKNVSQYKMTEEGLSAEDQAKQADLVNRLIQEKRQDYYLRANDNLIDGQFLALINLYKKAIEKKPKNCVALIMMKSIDHVTKRDADFNAALGAFDVQEANLIIQTDLTSPIQPFDVKQAEKLMEKNMPEELREKLQAKPESIEEECGILYAHMKHIADLPKEERVKIARLIFSDSGTE